MTTIASRFGSLGKHLRSRLRGPEEPSYMRTNWYDGSKYVDIDEFFEDDLVKEQVEMAAKEADEQEKSKKKEK